MRRTLLGLSILGLSLTTTPVFAQDAPQPLAAAPTQVTLSSGFSALTSGNVEAAKTIFGSVASTAAAGSREATLAQKLYNVTARYGYANLAGDIKDMARWNEAFGLLESGDALGADLAWLSLATSYPAGSEAQKLTYAISQIANEEAVQKLSISTAAPDALNVTTGNGDLVISAQESSVASGFTTTTAGALYGSLLGVIINFNVDIRDIRPAIGVVLATGTLGGYGGYAYYSKVHNKDLSIPKSAMISNGLLLGFIDGFFVNSLLDDLGVDNNDTSDEVVLTTSTLGLAAGILAAEKGNTQPGDSTVIASSALWSTILGLEALAFVEGEEFAKTTTAAYNLGIIGGIALAPKVDWSTRRVIAMNTAGGLGTLAGLLTGFLVFGDNFNEGTIIGGSLMAGSLGGLYAGYAFTKGMRPASAESSDKPAMAFQGIVPGITTLSVEANRTINALFTF